MPLNSRLHGLLSRWEEACRQGQELSPEELCRDQPEMLADLRHKIKEFKAANRELDLARTPDEGDLSPPARPAFAAKPGARRATPTAKASGGAALPPSIGRYRIEGVLGHGGFGLVYLAHDDQLKRSVAIKVPHAERVAQAGDADAYLAEARNVARLDHPNIVPVWDVGSTELFPCYIVSKFIEGCTLADRIKTNRPAVWEATELVATVAETLHYAHTHELVHRDIKPGNILLDTSDKPYVADFGLALKDEDYGKGPECAGTPAYMSPEQARGEAHRVDGRSDLFSLGVVFYELLTGRRPFQGASTWELLKQLINDEIRPLRQVDDRIPKELERICLKALSKRAADRYTTGKDMAEDLRHFLDQSTQEQQGVLRSPDPAGGVPAPGSATPPGLPAVPTPTSDQQPVKVVPKGLRSFDAHDADFFLALLPGPRDRDGLPDSIRFWKMRIEETDAEETFAVGLIYGPSGCGKSSLVKAGLLPRLGDAVIPVYVEATAEDTETRLLNGLRKRCPGVPDQLGLKETLAAVRRGQGIAPGKKVLLVLDQFEQWLHARKDPEHTELVQALRQCDGGRAQGIVMVRDDFWMAVTRFLAQLETELVQGKNMAPVDLFDLRHARKVLMAFGRAFGTLPEGARELTKEQDAFLDQAVRGLAPDGKIISVRLALFAEMVKGKPWTPATLKEVGGTEGVGVRFLEDTFSAATANPRHRLHQKAARAVLKALLPESGTDIKGTMRSHAELLEASGYRSRLKDFDDLLRILDSEIRLITPTDPEGIEQASEGRQPPVFSSPQGADAPRSPAHVKYYQLTHDYLVPSLREWLTRKQKETRRGRAELLLADRAAVWSARPENRQLPSLWQWGSIRGLTHQKRWTPPQRKMMRKATRYHAARVLVAALLLGLIGWGAYEAHGTLKAHALLESLLHAETTKVPDLVKDMTPYRAWLDPLLQQAYAQAEQGKEARKQLHASLALLPVDGSQVEYLSGRLLGAEPDEVPVIRDALAPPPEGLRNQLWAVVEAPPRGKEAQRLRAAAALATYDPENPRWDKVRGNVTNDLVNVPAVYFSVWLECFRPVSARLLVPLGVVYRDRQRRETERSLATDLLAKFAADEPHVLADLLMDADEKQFAVMYPKFKDQGERGLPVLVAEIDKKLPPELPSSDEQREKLAKRQANAAVALLRLNQPAKVWPLLKRSDEPDDPRLRSYLIHRLAPLGADTGAIVKRLGEEQDVTIRRALVLSLGEFGEEAWKPGEKRLLVQQLQETYRTAADPGLHAAAEWLLRQWQEQAWLRQTDEAWKKDGAQRAQQRESVKKELQKEKAAPRWFVNGQGQTMVVIPARGEFMMGSPSTEAGRFDYEPQHRKRIGRTFAIASKEVTVAQFRTFYKEFYGQEYTYYAKEYSPTPECPVNAVSWYQAAAYCNWLSKQEGIDKEDWCYVPTVAGRYADGVKLAPDWFKRTGYRLPTEAEWEFACRAGAVTSRYYGETEELLGKYVWYTTNSLNRGLLPGLPGQLGVRGDCLKPNDLGLFDMLGNALEWCQDGFGSYVPGEDKGDIRDNEGIKDKISRVLRGGSFYDQPRYVRCAGRNSYLPAYRNYFVGFRPARTLPLGSFNALPPTPEGGRN